MDNSDYAEYLTLLSSKIIDTNLTEERQALINTQMKKILLKKQVVLDIKTKLSLMLSRHSTDQNIGLMILPVIIELFSLASFKIPKPQLKDTIYCFLLYLVAKYVSDPNERSLYYDNLQGFDAIWTLLSFSFDGVKSCWCCGTKQLQTDSYLDD
jgi:hypothetical protein